MEIQKGVNDMPTNSVVPQRLLAIQDAATYTGISVHTLYTMVSQRRIPFVKVGRLVKFDLKMLDDWIKQQTVMPMRQRS